LKSLVNGSESGVIALADRGLQYGDGLFETIAVRRGRPRLLDLHLARLAAGCARLALPMPERALLEHEIEVVTEADEQVVKLVLTRGPAGRGYRAPEKPEPTRIVCAYPAPAPREATARVRTCSTPIGLSPALAGIKHLGRLENVMARSEWREARIAEGLMLDPDGHVVCATQSNLFLLREGELLTPLLDRAGVDGVMRRTVLRWARERCIVAREARLRVEDLHRAEEVFLTNALVGAWPVAELDGRPVRQGGLAMEFNAWLEDV
jgi:4-amino-4-deoxychorismate lyase